MSEPAVNDRVAPDDLKSPQAQSSAFIRHAAVLAFFLFSLGFPGRLTNFFGGEKVSMLIQYGIFGLQIAFMLLTSGDSFMEMKIIDLKKEYTAVYLMLAVFFITSMCVTHDPGAQLISCLRYSVTGLFAFWVVQWYDVKHILQFTYWAQSIIVILCLMFMLIPSQGWLVMNGERCFVGIFEYKNNCGAEIAFGLTLQFVLLRQYWNEKEQPSYFFYFIMLFQMIILVLSRAVGSMFSTVIPVLALFLIRNQKSFLRRLPLGLLYMVGSIGFLILALTMMPLLEPFLTALGKDATLTGRIPMWQRHVENMLTNNTFTGYGFCMFWKNPDAVAAFHAGFDEHSWASTMTTGAHNELLELWLDVGLIGIGAHFFMINQSFRRIKNLPDNEYIFCVILLLIIFIKGLTERSHTPAGYWTLYQFLACGMALKCKAQLPVPQAQRRLKEPVDYGPGPADRRKPFRS